jgi:hypothetical protein
MRLDVGTGNDGWMRLAHAMRAVPFALIFVVGGCFDRLEGPRQRSAQDWPEPSFPPATPVTPAPPPPPVRVRVAAVTTGAELDPDGYLVEVQADPDDTPPHYARDTVGTNGSTVFELPRGSYYASLSGIAPNCTAADPLSYQPFSAPGDASSPDETLVTLKVQCLAIPATQGLLVKTATTGTFPDTASFTIWIESDSGAAQPFRQNHRTGPNESVTMPSPIGSFRVWLSTDALWPRCTASPQIWQSVGVEEGRLTALSFKLTCM